VRTDRGFTLLELMVTVVILGTLLLLVPANLAGFGARSRLENSANTLAAAMAGAREQAITDGYEARLQIGSWKDEDGTHQGYRYLFTNVPPAGTGSSAEDADRRKEAIAERGRERQWLASTWHALEAGVRFVGVSEEASRWRKIPEQEGFEVYFLPDGGVQKAFAVRIESQDMEVAKEHRTMTILMNGLTSESSVEDGEVELPQKREAREFN
jgi:prepilin-type N-terminal cleavage/methylation domain-containing protein